MCREGQQSGQKDTGRRIASVRQSTLLKATATASYHLLGLHGCCSSVAVSSSFTDPEASGSRETQDVLWGCKRSRQSPAEKYPEAGFIAQLMYNSKDQRWPYGVPPPHFSPLQVSMNSQLGR